MIAFLGGFVVVMLLMLAWFITPGLEVLGDPDATDGDRMRIAAVAALLLAVLLVMLFVGLVLTFRVRRYFFGDLRPRETTRYSDAWAESANRLTQPGDSREE